MISLSADWALLDCAIDRKVRDIIFEPILSPTENCQNIQYNPEYNSVLLLRIIVKIFAVNMLFYRTTSGDYFCITNRGHLINLKDRLYLLVLNVIS